MPINNVKKIRNLCFIYFWFECCYKLENWHFNNKNNGRKENRNWNIVTKMNYDCYINNLYLYIYIYYNIIHHSKIMLLFFTRSIKTPFNYVCCTQDALTYTANTQVACARPVRSTSIPQALPPAVANSRVGTCRALVVSQQRNRQQGV